MKASESTIVRLIRDSENHITDEGGLSQGCYSWTVDEILQNVMEMKSSRIVEYNLAMSDFERALDEDNRSKAQNAYKRLLGLIRPGNELAELLRIQMIGLDSSKND